MTRPAMFSLAAAILWGVWALMAKLSADRIGHWQSALIYSAISLLTILALTLLNRADLSSMKTSGIMLAVASGILGGFAVAAFQKAITIGPLSTSLSLTALYPIIPVFYGIMLLGEEITVTKGIGMGLAVVAGVMLNL